MADKKCEKVMESKRLFVGGLYNGVLVEDLRAKFKPFGNVKDLEIISREDESGVPLKTFAYINIDISEKDFKKCLTTYNNCNWKGNVLKVQVAKEDFLSRLQKEKTANQTESEKSSNHILDKSVVMDIKSAVPGTPVPEKRNWVIGKFGRAMPIVYLRRKDGKKVAKFDPSKTSHCLKRIRVSDRQSKSVDNLTWKLGSCYPVSNRSLDDYNLNKDCEIRKKHNSKKRSICEVEDGNEDRTSGKSRTKKKDTKTDILCHNLDSNGYGIAGNDNNNSFSEVNESRVKHSESKVDEDCLAKRDLDLDDEDQGSTGCDASLLKSDDDSSPQDVKTEVKSLYKRSDDANKLAQDKMLVSNDDKSLEENDDCSSQVSRQSLNDDDSSSTDAVELENSKTDSVNRKSEILDNDRFSTASQSDSLSDEDSFLESDHDITDPEDQASSNEDLISTKNKSLSADLKTSPKTACSTRLAINSPSKLSKVKDAKTKKEESNKLRLESLKVRTQVIRNQKDVVRTALQKIDTNNVTGSNHVTLEEDGGVLKSPPGEKKITGSKALSWLGMDSSSDDDGDKDDEIFGWKEQFDGKPGEKLMKLQQKFGHDQRFKMDERFLGDDQEVDSVSVVKNEGDEIDQQIKEEKQMSLKILQDLLGSNSVFVRENDDSRNQYRDSLITHYDPSREDHAKFEEAVVKSVKPDLKESIVPENLSETKEPEVTKEKFYSVSHSLQNFFGKKNDESGIFSFFPDFDENDQASKSDNTAEPDKTTQWKAPLKLRETLPYDSSATESEDENEEPIILSEVDSAPKTQHIRHLFYHPENKLMMNSLKEESSSFMRKESIENLKKYWVKVRQNLTLDYKKKRKDALRRQKKIACKKPGSG